jgi:hypothetical protein
MLAAVFVLLGTGTAFAQPNEVKSARDKVSESVEQVQLLGTGVPQGVREFDVKRQALDRVIGLTTAELTGVRDRLAGFSIIDSELFLLAELVSEAFGQFEASLEHSRKELAGAKNGDDLKAFAVRFESWRTGTYAPELRKGIELAFVLQNVHAIDLAEARLAKFSVYLKRAKALKLSTKWEPFFTQAGFELIAAKELEEQMRELLRVYLPQAPLTDEAQSAVSPADEPAAQEAVTSEKIPSINELAKLLIVHVKGAYEAFIRIAQEIQGKK